MKTANSNAGRRLYLRPERLRCAKPSFSIPKLASRTFFPNEPRGI